MFHLQKSCTITNCVLWKVSTVCVCVCVCVCVFFYTCELLSQMRLTSVSLCQDGSLMPVKTAHSVWSGSPLSLATPTLHSHWSEHISPPSLCVFWAEQSLKCKGGRRLSSSPKSDPSTGSCEENQAVMLGGQTGNKLSCKCLSHNSSLFYSL